MASTIAFQGGSGSPTDFNTAANWVGGVVPANGDSLLLDHRAQNSLLVNLTQAGKTFPDVWTTEQFLFSLGAVGALFKPDAITRLRCNIGGAGSVYTDCSITTAEINSQNQSETAVVLDSTSTADLLNIDLYNGKVVLSSTASFAANGRISVGGGKLTMNTGVTFAGTNAILRQSGGTVLCKADLDTGATACKLRLDNGTFFLQDAADLALVDQFGGTFEWDGTGTVTLASVHGGLFRSGFNAGDLAKTLTECFVYDGAIADFSRAWQMTRTNGVVLSPGAVVRWPAGAKVNTI